MNVLITGANRGIGLGFVNHYLELGAHVWACYRNNGDALRAINNPRLQLIQWDVTEPNPQQGQLPDSLDPVEGLAQSHPTEPNPQQGQLPDSLDLLINNAGIYGPAKQSGQTLQTVTAESMMQVFAVDCVAPLGVVQKLLPALISSKGRIANISSKMGSSSDNSSGSCYAYRAAKAALIITSKSMAIDLAEYSIKVITLHPGWVQTDMTNHTGEIDISTSVSGMCRVIDTIDNYPTGAFVAYDGVVIPY